jgi:hypothetical protein
MAETYGWTLDYINGLSVFVVQQLGEASTRLTRKRPQIGGD